jgi:hypothetical protein
MMTKHDDRVVMSRFAAGLFIVAFLASVVLFGMCALELSTLNAVHDGSVQAKSLPGQPRSQSPPPSSQLLRGGADVASSKENQGTEWACTGASNSIGEIETGNGALPASLQTKREPIESCVAVGSFLNSRFFVLAVFLSFSFLPSKKKGCDTVEHLPPFDPLVWGPFAWKLLHTMGVSYPDKPDEAHVTACNNFMNRSFFFFFFCGVDASSSKRSISPPPPHPPQSISLPFMLPCGECGRHLKDYFDMKPTIVFSSCQSKVLC